LNDRYLVPGTLVAPSVRDQAVWSHPNGECMIGWLQPGVVVMVVFSFSGDVSSMVLCPGGLVGWAFLSPKEAVA